MKYYLTFPILLLLFLQSCQDENTPINKLAFYWDQTSCADPWNASSKDSDKEIKQAVEHYLNKQAVVGARVTSITNDGVHTICLACSCTTGNRINLTVPIDQKSKMIDLGFKESQ